MPPYSTMDDGPLSEFAVHRVRVDRKREQRAAKAEGDVDPTTLRKATPANEPLPIAFKWIARLPRDVQPLNLLRQYPRVANNLAARWGDRKAFRACLYDLLVDTRGGNRRGFPAPVTRELLALREYFEHVDCLPPLSPASPTERK